MSYSLFGKTSKIGEQQHHLHHLSKIPGVFRRERETWTLYCEYWRQTRKALPAICSSLIEIERFAVNLQTYLWFTELIYLFF